MAAIRQAMAIDIDENARTGGTNFDLAVNHIRNGVYDFLIIKAGLGIWKSEIFDEQRQLAEKAGIPYLTYHLVDPHSPDDKNPKKNMRLQAKHYVDWVGKNQSTYFVDIENPGSHSRLPKREELKSYLGELIRLTGKRPVLYSRVNIFESITGFMEDAGSYDLWIADYMEVKPGQENNEGLYRYFDDFLELHKSSLPPTVRGTNLEKKVIMWQFSKKGNGPHYIYSEKIGDNKDGKQSADLSVSIKGRDELLKKLFGKIPDLPKAVPISDSLTAEQINQFVKSGITPNMKVAISIDDIQIEEFVSQQKKLVKSGITPKIKVNIREAVSK